MSTESPKMDGRYLYAVVAGAEDKEYGPIGIDGGPVYAVNDGQVAAVVSDLPYCEIRPERRRLAAHHAVLKELMTEGTPLPLAFGVIADSIEAIHDILTENREIFSAELERLAGKVEMGLKVAWDTPNIFEYLVQTHEELREVRDHCFRPSRKPSQQDMIEVGRTVDRIIKEDRQQHTEKILEILSPYCYETEVNHPRNEKEVLNLACLVGRDAQDQFEKGVFKAASLFDNNYAFDYSGPWAPHNFVHIDLHL